jgi:GNAT superfamily N-acetyltransferase
VKVRPLVEADLPAADRIFRQAFGTFLGLPDPSATFGDADYVRTRWLADPAASLGAELDGDLVASNFVTNWGSIGVFGPLTVRPDLWDRGIAKRLMDATVDILEEWGVRLGGLFTFAHSAKHIGLYHRYGFWPQHLTFVMAGPTSPAGATTPWTALSATPPAERPAMVAACREVADLIYQDLDVSREVEQVDRQVTRFSLAMMRAWLPSVSVTLVPAARQAAKPATSSSARCDPDRARAAVSSACWTGARSWPRNGAQRS